MPVKVTRWPDPGRLPSPCRAHHADSRSRSGCDPGFGSVLDALSSRGLGHLTVVPSSRLGPVCTPRCLPRELLEPTSPDDFCSLSRPADTSANPDPRRRTAENLATSDHPPSRAPHPAQRGGGRDAGWREEAERSSRPRPSESPEHPSSSSRAFENRERSSQPLETS